MLAQAHIDHFSTHKSKKDPKWYVVMYIHNKKKILERVTVNYNADVQNMTQTVQQ